MRCTVASTSARPACTRSTFSNSMVRTCGRGPWANARRGWRSFWVARPAPSSTTSTPTRTAPPCSGTPANGFEGHRVEAAGGALPIRAVSGLDQGQEPGQPGDAAASVGAMVNDRRSPAPWRADKIAGGYVVRDANGQALVYVYSRDNDAEALQARVLTKDEARRIAINVARLPQLLGKSD
jgi:hypothetical protein